MFIIFSVSIIDKSNNIVLDSSNVVAKNKFEIKTEKDCLSTSVQNSMYLKDDDCYAKDETDNYSNTSSSYSGSMKFTTFQDNDNNYRSHNIEE